MHRVWKRLDDPGLELAQIQIGSDEIMVKSTLIFGGKPPFSLLYSWTLTPDWRTRTLDIAHADGSRRVAIARAGDLAWRLNGKPAPRLDGCAELDVSATPFCNGLAIRMLGGDGELTAAYVEAETLELQPSRQRYVKLGERQWRYHDLGVAKGFKADLQLDAEGHVRHYEGLFEAIS